MPDEVFACWLGEIIAANGWPFVSVGDSVDFDRWPGYFLGLSLADWANAVWSQHTFEQSAIRLSPQFARLVMDVATHALTGRPAFIGAQVTDSARRVGTHRDFILRQSAFPGFITALDRGGMLDIADGNHRLAALWLAGTSGIRVPFWIARKP